MSEVTPGQIDAARRWAESVASVSPYAMIISLCDTIAHRDTTITALREQIAAFTAALEKEPPSDEAMTERIRALRFAIPFTIADERQIARLLADVTARYTDTYGTQPDEEQVRRVCGLNALHTTAPATATPEEQQG